ncbi:MAG TPA: hypothetical protein VF601_17305 [Beijerinckiaceae bacterium]
MRLAAVAAFAFVSGAAVAAMDPAKVAAAKKAGDDFLALAKGSETTGQVPRQTDPKVKPLLDKVFDRTALGATVLPIAESGKVGELLNNANRIGFAYMLAGTGLTSLDKLGENQKAMDQAERNIGQFAPEIGRWFDYQMIIQGAIADSTSAFLATAQKNVLDNPQVKEGLGQVRSGLAGSLRGVLQMMSSDTIDDNWRRDRLASLAEIVPKAAKLVTPEDAASLKESATQLANALADPGLQAGLRKFGETVASGPKP